MSHIEAQGFYSFFCGAFQPSIVICLDLSTVNALAGAGFDIVEPAPIVAPAPIFTGATSSTPEPMKAPSPIVVRCLLAPS